MHLQNPFSDDTRTLFIWKYDCDWCGHNNWSDLHHILGRVSNSPLNASTVHNQKCHIGNGNLATFDVKRKLLRKTFNYLINQRYELTEEDKLFMKKNSRYYEINTNA